LLTNDKHGQQGRYTTTEHAQICNHTQRHTQRNTETHTDT